MRSKTKLNLCVLMTMVMMALSPQSMWADGTPFTSDGQAFKNKGCGEVTTVADMTIPATGDHNFVNGECTGCDAVQFTYTAASAAAANDLNAIFNDKYTSIGTVTCGTWTDASTPVTVTISGKVTTIGITQFSSCTNLTSITIPESVTSIGNMAFFDCSSLTSISIPESVTTIGGNAFLGCSSLTSISIPKSVTTIGQGVIAGCKDMKTVTVAEDNNVYRSEGNCIIKKEDNTLIVACNNSTIPNGVTSIGAFAFTDCSDITSITIPEGVETIEEKAFHGCSSLTSITIPASVVTVGYEVFIKCDRLTTIICKNVRMNLGEHTFYNISEDIYKINSDLTIYVPSDQVDQQQFGENWGDYMDYIKPMPVTLVSGTTTTDFMTFAEAIAAATDGSTITLNKDIDEEVTIDDSKYTIGLTIRTQGHQLNGANLEGATCWHKTTDGVYTLKGTHSYVNGECTGCGDEPTSFDASNFSDDAVYSRTSNCTVTELTYKRTFANNDFNCLYLPFKANVTSFTGCDIYVINMFQYRDTDGDGTLDALSLEVDKVTSGILLDNHPYLIKYTGEGVGTEQSMTFSNVTLEAAETPEYVCSSMSYNYTFKGTYSAVDAATASAEGYYTLTLNADNKVVLAPTNNGLKGQRWFMTMEARDPQLGSVTAPGNVRGISIIVSGEHDRATDIRDINAAAGAKVGKYTDRSGRIVIVKNGMKYNTSGLIIK